ncbi:MULTISPECIES: SH3 domain-containing protein [unclassified Bartonella]|uniref:SH3 domain-containing protein n=1 Tax=unclassified Bartonella TaxID=2645622 RepID=UPI0023614FBF|nr:MULTISPECIES: SH3 domain-containing protein [unclassified Bartonella]
MFKKNFLSTTLILSALGGVGLGVTTAYAALGNVARVASGQAVLRSGPATAYKVIATVPMGEKVQINGCLSNKTWCSLGYNGKVGWVFARYLNVNNVPTISFTDMSVKPNSAIKTQKQKVKQIVSGLKNLAVPEKTRKKAQKFYRTDMIIDSTGVKKRDEQTIFNPSAKAQGVSVKHVNAYNPFFPEDVNFKNFERNETRYRVVTYPAP